MKIPPADLKPYEDLLSRIVPPKPRWPTRPVALVALAVVVLVVVGGWQVPTGIDKWRADCEWRPWASGGLVRTAVRDGQCVGYSDHERQLFSSDESLRDVQRKIFDQNREVEAAWRVRKDRPRVTLVYFGSLTKPDALPGEETFAGEREELQGMAAAQRRAYLEANEYPAYPYLRIVVANAGQEMRYSADVVRMLSALAEEEPTVLGVVGLVESRKAVQDAIRALGRLDLPVLAPTLSADGIADASSRYLQISAPNRDEATLVHEHVTRVLGKKKLFNYYTFGSADPDEGAQNDLYVNTLRDGLRDRFGEGNYQETYWRNGVDLASVCADRFRDGVVFFGGRYSEFGAFVSRLAQACSGRVPQLIGDDSVNRYLANTAARVVAPDNLPLAYVSKGELAYCNRLVGANDTERKLFLNDVRTVLSMCSSNTPIGERVGLAYDATRLHLAAVQTLAGSAGREWDPTAVSPTTVYLAIHDVANPYYRGVTGLLRFDANGIAVRKRLTLLCVPNIKEAFNSPSYVPREIDRHPNDPEENRLYDTPPPVQRPCAAAE
ncbi:ABC transporter substrate-binding protein [Micromonospora olivasterospora]|uniref:ABC-type branched-subunit amino acid transport system substrate-binding protein n=1 Tax=Micromonospora olivasterospora TaxID=1880 RepID=A0A562IBE9_MICOL|nr:ABC transporter substrate-binding protein [Micromonospora olivasterospora]TWH68108.1 ABC-type branched-subunit amino acid transport system substrate-binding protein [Micromonospora olivasterospora]